MNSLAHEIHGYGYTKGDSRIDFFAVHSSELQDADQDDEKDVQTRKQELVRACPAVDLVVYCVDMTTVRVSPADKAAFQYLTDCFSALVWEKAIFTLTFANMVERPPSFKGNDEEFFDHKLSQFKGVIQKMLLDMNVPRNIVREIPIIPTGYSNSTQYVQNPWNLCGQKDWFSNFWSLCVTRMERGACMAQLKLSTELSGNLNIVKQISFTGSLVGATIGAIIGFSAGNMLGILSARSGAVVGLVVGGGFGSWLFSRK